jgi:hypothetical protein
MTRTTDSPREDAREETPPRVPLLPDDVGLRPTTAGHVLLPFELLTDEALSKAAIRVAAVVARTCSRASGRYWKRLEDLARDAGLGVSTARVALEKLRASGWIARGWIWIYGKLRPAIAIRWRRVLPRPSSKACPASPSAPLLAGLVWDAPRAESCAPEAQIPAPPYRKSEMGFEGGDNVNVVLRPQTPDAPRVEEALGGPPSLTTGPEVVPNLAPSDGPRARLSRPASPETIADGELAGLLEVLGGPFKGMAAAAYWTLLDAGRLPAEWADREAPGPRPAPEPAPRPKARLVGAPARKPSTLELTHSAIVAVTTSNDEQLVVEMEHAANMLNAELGDGSINYHRRKLRELALKRSKPADFFEALRVSRSPGVRNRAAIYTAKLEELTGGSVPWAGEKNPAPGSSPKFPGAGPNLQTPPRQRYPVYG